eukprot:CAMPEP_0172615414 /NCGR_PEP_ID=MMETSP1068-20121228/58909_1 /TAXON_ID=35684 /ORGANISM="Pseudopedinella elastica, Strain CCMP716" /LENGTH=315 /DNA_ID=CAMNT_0013420541 /DNA_START=65 /DNA_END=1012 /DNA_ORIENTATION=+
MGLLLLLIAGAASAFSPAPRLGARVLKSSPTSLKGAADAWAAISASQADTVAKLRAALPVSDKPDQSWPAGSGATIAGSAATLEAMDAPGPPNVAWVSALNVEGKVCSLTVLNGPLTSVPHFCSRCVIDGDQNTLSLFLDWRPRADGMYGARKPDGSYPGPEELGRAAFEFSGNRAEMERKFYTPELESFVSASVASFEGAQPPAAPPSSDDADTRGPLAVDVTMPLTDGNVAAVVRARAQAFESWLGWQLDREAHLHRPGAPVNSQYVFDTPVKQKMYTALLGKFTALFGDADGAKLAAADSGPLDEAYVGGAS